MPASVQTLRMSAPVGWQWSSEAGISENYVTIVELISWCELSHPEGGPKCLFNPINVSTYQVLVPMGIGM